MVHGWMDVSASYQFVVDALQTERFVIAPDWRGFGLSTGPWCDHYAFADYLGDLDALLEALRSEGCEVDPRVEASEFGKFGWVMDPEGNRIELWQPPDPPAPLR